MTLEAWVQEVLGELKKCAFGSDEYHTGSEPHLPVESVELDGPLPRAAIVLIFQNLKRSAHGRYGYCWDNLPYWFDLDADAPEAQAHTIWANFEEVAVKTPEHPGSDEIVWID